MPTPEVPITRLVLWNIDLTLLDVGRVTREAYAEAFRRVTGRSLRQLPQMPGRMESEIFFDALALNEAGGGAAAGADAGAGLASTAGQGGEELLARFSFELAGAFAARRGLLAEQGRLLPGAAEAVTGLAGWPGVVQTVLTGGIKPNAVEKLRAFGLEQFFDLEVGGYGSQVYPKGAQLMMTRSRAADKYGTRFDEGCTVYIADSIRDVAAARTGGARCLAVASGRSTVSELRKAGADVVFDDLCDTAAIVAAVDRLTLAAAG
ncbi:MAG TPA: HAD hydrolase-like protein [Streptosporangiaceae bacterium]|jgi:phosphoglycolate phosphatase-like HAD superfamily hydrolase